MWRGQLRSLTLEETPMLLLVDLTSLKIPKAVNVAGKPKDLKGEH